MVADLVRDHVGGREVARRAEAAAQFVEEAEIQVDLGIGRAVERADRRSGVAATRADALAEQHQLGRLIGAAGLLEELRPGVFGVAQHVAHHRFAVVVVGLAGGPRGAMRCTLHGRVLRHLHHHAEDFQRVLAHQQADHRHQRDTAHAQAHPAAAEAAATRGCAIILDVLAFAHVIPTHVSLLAAQTPGCCTRQTLQSLPGLVPSAHAGRPEKCLRVPRTPGSIEAGPIGRGAPGPAGNLLSEAARAVSWRLTHASCATAITLARPLRLPCNHSRVLPCACLLRPLPIRPIRRRCRDLPSRRAMPPRRRQR